MKEWTNRVSTEIKRNYEWFEPEKSVLEHSQQHENILEIGSGMGRYTKLIPRIVGLEYSRLFIDYCKDNIEGSVANTFMPNRLQKIIRMPIKTDYHDYS